MRCVDCGRLLKRAAFTLPARNGVHDGGALGPKCAQARGLVQPKRSPLFTLARRRVRARPASPQMALELA